MEIQKEYQQFLALVKHKIVQTKYQVSKRINKEQIALYWQIGELIVQKQEELGWGKSVVEQLAKDLKIIFPKRKGFSARNMWDMRKLYLAYIDFPNLRQLVAEVPWKHNLLIMGLKNIQAQTYYLQQTSQHAWTRDILTFQMKGKAYERSLLQKKTHNFQQALPENLAKQADEIIKSEYVLDFLGLENDFLERELEQKIVENLKTFLLELGYGFTFVGQQYRILLAEKEYFIDLLFFHRKLKCLVAIELKIGEFEPEYAGKMNFYLEVLDDTVKMPDENRSLGIVLCSKKNDIEVEYALRNIQRPIGVAEYSLTKDLPQNLQNLLPTPKDLKEIIQQEIKKK